MSFRSWLWAFAGLIFGILADLLNRKILFLITTGFTAVSCLMFALIPSHLGSDMLIFFIIVNSIAGIGLGGNYPLVHSISSDNLNESQRSQFFGIYYAINLVLSNAGMIISSIAFKHDWWREFFLVEGILFSGRNSFGEFHLYTCHFS